MYRAMLSDDTDGFEDACSICASGAVRSFPAVDVGDGREPVPFVAFAATMLYVDRRWGALLECALAHGADAAVGDDVHAPVLAACRALNGSLVRLLLRHGASASSTGGIPRGHSPLHAALSIGRIVNSFVRQSLARHADDVVGTVHDILSWARSNSELSAAAEAAEMAFLAEFRSLQRVSTSHQQQPTPPTSPHHIHGARHGDPTGPPL